MDPTKCKQLIDEFYKTWEASGGHNFPGMDKFIAWVEKNKTSEDKINCKQLMDEFEKTEKPFHKNPNIKLEDLCLATFMEWIRKRIATAKKASEKDWVGNFLNS